VVTKSRGSPEAFRIRLAAEHPCSSSAIPKPWANISLNLEVIDKTTNHLPPNPATNVQALHSPQACSLQLRTVSTASFIAAGGSKSLQERHLVDDLSRSIAPSILNARPTTRHLD